MAETKRFVYGLGERVILRCETHLPPEGMEEFIGVVMSREHEGRQNVYHIAYTDGVVGMVYEPEVVRAPIPQRDPDNPGYWAYIS